MIPRQGAARGWAYASYGGVIGARYAVSMENEESRGSHVSQSAGCHGNRSAVMFRFGIRVFRSYRLLIGIAGGFALSGRRSLSAGSPPPPGPQSGGVFCTAHLT